MSWLCVPAYFRRSYAVHREKDSFVGEGLNPSLERFAQSNVLAVMFRSTVQLLTDSSKGSVLRDLALTRVLQFLDFRGMKQD